MSLITSPERRGELLARYAAGFEDSLDATTLAYVDLVGEGRNRHLRYRCPCGASDHYATRAMECLDIPSIPGEKQWAPCDVLHCWETQRQWFLRGPDVQAIVAKEEAAFEKLMDRFARLGTLGKKVTAVEAFRLTTEQGCPAECLEIDGLDEYDRMMDEHRRKSGKRA